MTPEPTTEQILAFVREQYGATMAERMGAYFLEREPADAAESGFLRSVRRSLIREMRESA